MLHVDPFTYCYTAPPQSIWLPIRCLYIHIQNIYTFVNAYFPVLWIKQIKMLCYVSVTTQYSTTINSCYIVFITVSWVTGTVKKRQLRATAPNGIQQISIFFIIIILIIIFSPSFSIFAETKIAKGILTQVNVAPKIWQFELVL